MKRLTKKEKKQKQKKKGGKKTHTSLKKGIEIARKILP